MCPSSAPWRLGLCSSQNPLQHLTPPQVPKGIRQSLLPLRMLRRTLTISRLLLPQWRSRGCQPTNSHLLRTRQCVQHRTQGLMPAQGAQQQHRHRPQRLHETPTPRSTRCQNVTAKMRWPRGLQCLWRVLARRLRCSRRIRMPAPVPRAMLRELVATLHEGRQAALMKGQSLHRTPHIVSHRVRLPSTPPNACAARLNWNERFAQMVSDSGGLLSLIHI